MRATHCFAANYSPPTHSAIKLSNFPSPVSCDSERQTAKGVHMIRLPARRYSQITRMEQGQLLRDVHVNRGGNNSENWCTPRCNTMEYPGIPSNIVCVLEYPGRPRNTSEYPGILWNTPEYYVSYFQPRIPRKTPEDPGRPRKTNRTAFFSWQWASRLSKYIDVVFITDPLWLWFNDRNLNMKNRKKRWKKGWVGLKSMKDRKESLL